MQHQSGLGVMGLLVLFGVHQAVEPQELRFGVRSDPCHGAQLRVLRTGKDSEQLLLDCVLCIYIYIPDTPRMVYLPTLGWFAYKHGVSGWFNFLQVKQPPQKGESARFEPQKHP